MASPDLKRAEIQGDVSGVSPDRIMQLGFGFMASRTLLSAAELGVFTKLANHPMDGERSAFDRRQWWTITRSC